MAVNGLIPRPRNGLGMKLHTYYSYGYYMNANNKHTIIICVRVCIMEVGGSGARTRLVTCVQPLHVLYFVLRGKITSRRTLGHNQGLAAEVDAIMKWLLKQTQSGRSGGIQILLDWTTGLDHWTGLLDSPKMV